MLGEKRSGDIFGPGPKRETGGQEAMAGEAVNSPKVEPQNEQPFSGLFFSLVDFY